jgi:hypothetical protein
MFERTYIRPYQTALTLSNPGSAMSKFGAGLEYRRGRWAYFFNYNKYIGVYKGKMYDAGYKYYLKRQMRHIKNQWAFQDFFYVRSVIGEAEYQGGKFPFLGLPTAYELLYTEYIGLAGGFGRRYQKGIFFISVNAGLKATYLGVDEETKIYYRLFYVAGPGSVIEANANFGIQL